MSENLIQFFGRLHPLLVHLPIGILFLAVCLHFLSRWPRYAMLRDLMPVLWFAGAVTAVLACLAGYLLKLSGDYTEESVNLHQNLGIALAVVTVILVLVRSRNLIKWLQTPFVLLITVLLTATGHYGGNLTHGEDYLKQPVYALIGKTPGKKVRPIITNVNEALVYRDLVEPVLEQKCWACHSAQKQKGKLRLDTEEYLSKGGKHGEILVAGNANESELYKRLILPEDNDDRMPPKSKPQLTEAEIQLINWWIIQGKGDFTKKVAQVPKDEAIDQVIAEVRQGGSPAVTNELATEFPAVKVSPANPAVVQKLQSIGVVLTPVAKGNAFLMVNLVNAKKFSDADMPLLAQLSEQVVWLDMSESHITDKGLQHLALFRNLTRLSLDNTGVTDVGLKNLQALSNLHYLNLYGTNVTDKGINSIASCKNLTAIYLWQTKVTPQGVAALQKVRGESIEINFGSQPDTLNIL